MDTIISTYPTLYKLKEVGSDNSKKVNQAKLLSLYFKTLQTPFKDIDILIDTFKHICNISDSRREYTFYYEDVSFMTAIQYTNHLFLSYEYDGVKFSQYTVSEKKQVQILFYSTSTYSILIKDSLVTMYTCNLSSQEFYDVTGREVDNRIIIEQFEDYTLLFGVIKCIKQELTFDRIVTLFDRHINNYSCQLSKYLSYIGYETLEKLDISPQCILKKDSILISHRSLCKISKCNGELLYTFKYKGIPIKILSSDDINKVLRNTFAILPVLLSTLDVPKLLCSYRDLLQFSITAITIGTKEKTSLLVQQLFQEDKVVFYASRSFVPELEDCNCGDILLSRNIETDEQYYYPPRLNNMDSYNPSSLTVLTHYNTITKDNVPSCMMKEFKSLTETESFNVNDALQYYNTHPYRLTYTLDKLIIENETVESIVSLVEDTIIIETNKITSKTCRVFQAMIRQFQKQSPTNVLFSSLKQIIKPLVIEDTVFKIGEYNSYGNAAGSLKTTIIKDNKVHHTDHHQIENNHLVQTKSIDSNSSYRVISTNSILVEGARYGYKIAKLPNKELCVVTLVIPVDGKVAISENKLRCDRALVLKIERLVYLNDAFVLESMLNTKQCICEKATIECVIYPCRHYSCLVCATSGDRCPCCKNVLTNVQLLDVTVEEQVAHSCVYATNFDYNLGTYVQIDNFTPEDSKNGCLPGIHYQSTSEEAIKYWASHSNMGTSSRGYSKVPPPKLFNTVKNDFDAINLLPSVMTRFGYDIISSENTVGEDNDSILGDNNDKDNSLLFESGYLSNTLPDSVLKENNDSVLKENNDSVLRENNDSVLKENNDSVTGALEDDMIHLRRQVRKEQEDNDIFSNETVPIFNLKSKTD